MHDSGTCPLRFLVMGVDHRADEVGLAGQVTVIRPVADAGCDDLGAILCIRADRGDEDLSFRSDCVERIGVEAIADQDRKLRGAHFVGDTLELLSVASGKREPKPGVATEVVACEVVSDEAAGEAGRAPEDDVEFARAVT